MERQKVKNRPPKVDLNFAKFLNNEAGEAFNVYTTNWGAKSCLGVYIRCNGVARGEKSIAMGAKTLSEWIEDLPDEIAGVKIRVGKKRSLPTIGVIALPHFSDEAESRLKEVTPIRILDKDELEELIEEEAAAAGYGEHNEALRLHALNSEGKHQRSWYQTAQPHSTHSGEGAVISRLVDGILKSNQELRKSVDILTGSLAHREDVLKDSIESMLEAQQHAVETEASSLLNMIESAIPAEPQNDPLRQQAAGILGQIGQLFTGAPQGPLTSDSLAEMMEANPEMVKEMLKSDRVKAAFTSAMSNNGVDS